MKIISFLLAKIYISLKKAYDSYKQNIYKEYTNLSIGNNVRITETAVIPKDIGHIIIGDRSWISCVFNIFPHNQDAHINIGEDCYIGDESRLWCAKEIIIGNRVLISHNVNIFDTTTHPINKDIRFLHETIVKTQGLPKESFDTIYEAPVTIEDDVWIGCNVIILKGISIGSGSIIAASSVVTKNVPPNVLVGGNPAKVLKQL